LVRPFQSIFKFYGVVSLRRILQVVNRHFFLAAVTDSYISCSLIL